jgi:alkaline phosphatase D
MKYAFSSSMPLFNKMLDAAPDLLLMIGDNMYANSTKPAMLSHFYLRMRTIASFAEVLANTPTWATWDDHDYTGNNKDGNSPGKENSLAAFQRYWANPFYGSDEVPGVWTSFVWGDVEFFLIDDRYHRSAGQGTMLGQTQLDWLLNGLQASTATFKVLASGSQWTLGGSSDSWATFAAEQALILDHIMEQGIDGVILISGDIHRTETRRLRDASATGYAVWEFTSSPIANNNSGGCPGLSEPDTVVFCENDTRYFSLLKFDTEAKPPKLTHETRNEAGVLLHAKTLSLDELSL